MRARCLNGLLLGALVLVGCIGPGGLKRADPLSGTERELVRLYEGAILPGSRITIRFEDGSVSGTAGCNCYGGRYQIRGRELAFTELVNTEMACQEGGVMAQEQAYLQALGEVTTWSYMGERLALYGGNKQTLLFGPAK
mgnify:CR=1 FL=1